jgi:hypothetical protein
LAAALGLVALFLLARVFFLAFGKTRSSSSWHPNLQFSKFGKSGWRFALQSNSELRQRRERNPDFPVHTLPARFPGLARVTLIIVPTATSTASKSLSAASPPAARGISLRLRFVDLEGATSKVSAIQCRYSFIGLAGIGHLDKCETAGSASFPVRDYTDAFDRPVRLEQPAKLWLGSAVG